MRILFTVLVFLLLCLLHWTNWTDRKYDGWQFELFRQQQQKQRQQSLGASAYCFGYLTLRCASVAVCSSQCVLLCLVVRAFSLECRYTTVATISSCSFNCSAMGSVGWKWNAVLFDGKPILVCSDQLVDSAADGIAFVTRVKQLWFVLVAHAEENITVRCEWMRDVYRNDFYRCDKLWVILWFLPNAIDINIFFEFMRRYSESVMRLVQF